MEQTVRCPSCGAVSAAGQQFCGKCGAQIVTEVQQQKIKCPKCGAQNLAGQQFCGNCGAGLVAVAQQAPAAQTKEAPAKVVSPVSYRQRVEVKPTWGLVWGLWWRGLILALLIGGIGFLIFMVITVLGLGWGLKLPFGA